MRAHPPKVLLIDDDEDSYIITRALLADVKDSPVVLEWVNTYEAGLEVMVRAEHDAYLALQRGFTKQDFRNCLLNEELRIHHPLTNSNPGGRKFCG